MITPKDIEKAVGYPQPGTGSAIPSRTNETSMAQGLRLIGLLLCEIRDQGEPVVVHESAEAMLARVAKTHGSDDPLIQDLIDLGKRMAEDNREARIMVDDPGTLTPEQRAQRVSPTINFEALLTSRVPAGFAASIRDVTAERDHQREKWGDDHDDGHTGGELSTAGAVYALLAWPDPSEEVSETCRNMWPWDSDPPDTEDETCPAIRGRLVRAAALILAEIDRLDR